MTTPLRSLFRTLRPPMAVFALACGLSVLAAPAHAQFGGSHSYQFGVPGGNFGGGGGQSNTVMDIGFKAGAGADFLGCGGVGLFDYLQTTFNVENIIDQMKSNMQTMMAKTMLTSAMSVPAVSSVFDSLNAFGNAKFDMFQQSCDMTQVRKEAKDMFMKRCMSSKDSGTCDAQWNQGEGKLANNSIMKGVKNLICQRENVNQTARGIACGNGGGGGGAGGGAGGGVACSVMALMPQVKVNLGGSGLDCGGGGYGSQPAVLTANSMRQAVEGGVDSVIGQISTAYDRARTGLTPAENDMILRKTMAACAGGACGKSGSSKLASGKQPFMLASRPFTTVAYGAPEANAKEGSSKMLTKFKQRIAYTDENKCLNLMNEYFKNAADYGVSIDEFKADDLFKETKLNASSSGGGGKDLEELGKIVDVQMKQFTKNVCVFDPSIIVALGKRSNAVENINAHWDLAAKTMASRVTIPVLKFAAEEGSLAGAQMGAAAETGRSDQVAAKVDKEGENSSGKQEENVDADKTSKAFLDGSVEVLKAQIQDMQEADQASYWYATAHRAGLDGGGRY